LLERAWPGAELHIGDVILRLDSLRSRCHMTTIDPDTLQVNPDVLRDIVRRFDNRLALNTDILSGGTIRVGDPVRLVRPSPPGRLCLDREMASFPSRSVRPGRRHGTPGSG
jgi:uncharacterized protein YcbX